ncbi:AMP-dependent synthetase/ligase [Streptomyces gamaensis]|uniref:Acyl-CoA synthetase n=1 Tax=Streptomyces gamaensis TaxID=1763542 RepID=A0ABW0Z2C1_9ACTN
MRQRPGTLAVLAEWAAERYGERPAVRFRRRDGGWSDLRYDSLRASVRAAGRGLMALGTAPGDRVAILAETRPEWIRAHLGALAAGAAAVPVYPTAGEDELAWVLGDSGAVLAVCENEAQAARVLQLRGRLPGLRHVVLMERTGEGDGRGDREPATAPGADAASGAGGGPGVGAGAASGAGGVSGSGTGSGSASGAGGGLGAASGARTGSGAARGAVPDSPERLLTLDELPAHRTPLSELLARARSVEDDDLCAIVYTSGTTGLPKGCRLTHGNVTRADDATSGLLGGGPGDVMYLYLPLAHVYAQLVEVAALVKGATLCCFGGRMEDVVGELAEVRPTHLPSVPRLFEKVHATARSLAERRGPEGAARFAEAVRVGVAVAEARERGEGIPAGLRAVWQEAEELLYAPVRAALGGRLRWALTGAAPIARQTLDFLRACGVPVFEGYGMTEASGVITMNHPGAVRYGTVGRAVPGCEVRIAADGEVLARGPGVFAGYHANPAATAQKALDAEGWLHTGDLGALDADGYLSITGRKKDLIITSGGKNLTPTLTEFALQQSRWISRAVMVGDRRPYPVALLTLDVPELAAWAEREGLALGPRPGRHPAVRALCERAVADANGRLSGPSRIRAFEILDEDFSVADGTLTPTLKLRRSMIAERYAIEINALYEQT